jgi:site-specific DNA-methyltransferase (adenine-specific)
MIEQYINTIQNVDCIEFMRNLPANSIDLILSDPPYGISFVSSRTKRKDSLQNDKLDDWLDLIKEFLPESKRLLTDTGCCCCCCCGGKTPVTAYFTIEAIKHFYLIQTLVWKKFIGLGWRYRPSYENILVLSKDKDNYNFYDDSKSCSNVIEGINQKIPIYDYEDETNSDHPTQKPVELMMRLIEIHSKENDIIFDPFMGSGTTAIACIKTNRRFIGCEIEKKYCDIANKRIEAELHKKDEVTFVEDLEMFKS